MLGLNNLLPRIPGQPGGYPYVENALAHGQWRGAPHSIPRRPGMTDAMTAGQWPGAPYSAGVSRSDIAPEGFNVNAMRALGGMGGMGYNMLNPQQAALPPIQAPTPTGYAPNLQPLRAMYGRLRELQGGGNNVRNILASMRGQNLDNLQGNNVREILSGLQGQSLGGLLGG